MASSQQQLAVVIEYAVLELQQVTFYLLFFSKRKKVTRFLLCEYCSLFVYLFLSYVSLMRDRNIDIHIYTVYINCIYIYFSIEVYLIMCFSCHKKLQCIVSLIYSWMMS